MVALNESERERLSLHGVTVGEDGRWWRTGKNGNRIRIGNQLPTFEVVGDFDYTDSEIALDVFESWGISSFPSQMHEFDCYMARRADGSFASRTICITKPRQNGKSYAARNYALWQAAVNGCSVVYSAHDGTTTTKMFNELKNLVRDIDEKESGFLDHSFGDKGIYSTAGRESIRFASGGFIDFNCRTNKALRGASYQILIIDEAQELTQPQMNAVNPTSIAASDVDDVGKDPQKILIGTPPDSTCNGDVFRDYYDQAHSGNLGGKWWLEWSAREVVDLKDRAKALEVAYMTNPAMGYRIREDVMLSAMDDFASKPYDFAQEHLNWWAPKVNRNCAISLEAWDACGTDSAPGNGARHFAVKFSPDGSSVSLAVCVADSKPYLNVIERKSMGSGTQWLADWLLDREQTAASVIIDGVSSRYLIEKLDVNGFDMRLIETPKASDICAACDMLNNALIERSVTHFNQTSVREAVESTRKRNIGKTGWAFAGDGSDMMESMALAHWAALTKSKPTKKMMVAF